MCLTAGPLTTIPDNLPVSEVIGQAKNHCQSTLFAHPIVRGLVAEPKIIVRAPLLYLQRFCSASGIFCTRNVSVNIRFVLDSGRPGNKSTYRGCAHRGQLSGRETIWWSGVRVRRGHGPRRRTTTILHTCTTPRMRQPQINKKWRRSSCSRHERDSHESTDKAAAISNARC